MCWAHKICLNLRKFDCKNYCFIPYVNENNDTAMWAIKKHVEHTSCDVIATPIFISQSSKY